MAEGSLAVFSGVYCRGREVVAALATATGFRILDDEELIRTAAYRSGLPETTISRVFSSKRSVFDPFTQERKHALAYLCLVLADRMREPGLLITGYIAHLVPREITQMSRICLVADMPFRRRQAFLEGKLTEKEASAQISASDAEKGYWTKLLLNNANPWDAALYDMLLPMSHIEIRQAVEMIEARLKLGTKQSATNSFLAPLADFQLAAQASVALVRAGHDGEVTAREGVLTVKIKMKVLMFDRLQEELHSILYALSGVNAVRVEVDPGKERHVGIYRKYDQNKPSRVLLVDDEHDAVQAIARRLLSRDMGIAVAHDGQSALEMLVDDEPDILVLDLKMPDIHGIEVLRRVKKIRPSVEVIILTGHGSEADHATCLELGALAFLQKPVDIERLSSKLKEAYDHVKKHQSNS